MSYDFKDLKLFIAIAESGSLRCGAAQLDLAISSASARLGHLEKALNVELFSRHRRGLSMTSAGERLLIHAREVIAELNRLEADLLKHC